MTQPDLRRENRTARRPLSLTTLSGLTSAAPQGSLHPYPLRRASAQKGVGVDWYNNPRLLELLGHIPLAEAEQRYYASLKMQNVAA